MLKREDDSMVLDSGIAALGHLYKSAAIPIIAQYNDHVDDNVRFSVACALGHFPNDPGVVATLLNLTRDDDSELRDWAVFGPGVQGDVDSPEIRDLYVLNTKLDLLSKNEVLRNGFAVVNGIPYNEEALARLGSFSGDLDTWLDYNDAVSGLLANYRHTEATSWRSLANELTQGKDDVLILFAHSNGSGDLFLGDRPVSLKLLKR